MIDRATLNIQMLLEVSGSFEKFLKVSRSFLKVSGNFQIWFRDRDFVQRLRGFCYCTTPGCDALSPFYWNVIDFSTGDVTT